MKEYKKQIIALVMVLSMFCGVLIAPQTYRADTLVYDVPFSSSNTYFFYEYNGVYTQLSTLSQSASYSLSTNITHFRVVQKLDFTLKEGDVVTISGLNLRYAIGSFDNSNSWAWFGVPQSNTYATNSMCSIKRGITYVSNTNSVLSGSFTITADTSCVWFDFYLTSRSSTTVIQPYYGCSMKIERETDITDVSGTLDSIDSKGTSIIDSILNLPSNLASALGTLFGNIVTAVNDLPTNLGTLFGNIVSAIEDLPTNLGTLFGSIGAGVANATSYLFDNIVDAVGNMRDTVSSAFNSVISSVFPSSSGGGGHSIDGSNLENATNDLEDMSDSLNSDRLSSFFDDVKEYLPNDEHLVVRIYNLCFECEYIYRFVYLTFIVGCIAYVLYGKR